MTHAGGESAASGFREQMSGQLRAVRMLTALLQRGDREHLPVLEWMIRPRIPGRSQRSLPQIVRLSMNVQSATVLRLV
jgi:hypothetical protein